jgi:hypothetical protein
VTVTDALGDAVINANQYSDTPLQTDYVREAGGPVRSRRGGAGAGEGNARPPTSARRGACPEGSCEDSVSADLLFVSSYFRVVLGPGLINVIDVLKP